MHLPVRLLRGWLPARYERYLGRFVWEDPRIILNPAAAPDLYRRAMNAIHVGGTIKITGTNRHPAADSLLLEHVGVAPGRIVDIGASDGSTSLDLMRLLPDFTSYRIADLFLFVTVKTYGNCMFVYDPSGRCVLAAGERLIAWPALSPLVRYAWWPVMARKRNVKPDSTQEVLLLNPEVKKLLQTDSRVGYRVHNVFDVWDGETPDVIKIANLLRRLYFSDADILRALVSVLRSLPEGGHLLIVENSREKGVGVRAGLYRRRDDHFDAVASSGGVCEIENLVLATRAG